MNDATLWRSPPNLCTERGTVLWTRTTHRQETTSDLGFNYPPAVQEKNFSSDFKIAKNSLDMRAEPQPM